MEPHARTRHPPTDLQHALRDLSPDQMDQVGSRVGMQGNLRLKIGQG